MGISDNTKYIANIQKIIKCVHVSAKIYIMFIILLTTLNLAVALARCDLPHLPAGGDCLHVHMALHGHDVLPPT